MTSSSPNSLRSLRTRRLLNGAVTVGSVLLCLLLLPTRIPGMEILGVGPNWVLMWVVAWSVKRTAFEGAIAGLVLGLLQDAMTAAQPTHVPALMLVGVLTARLQKQRYIQEDIVSVALIVFGMAVIAETVTAIQISLHNLVQPGSFYPPLVEIWVYHQRVALSSAILSSLWAPAVYYPLNRWWEKERLIEPT
ncbi:MAG: rod shape-determining protein MreD [Leptolyngbyaceae cyanobacterium SM1_1_3]|nr:rod shape-determining protein MreD [Leptolyngbyaceae cyanobacterium SM1_1_3]NJN03751.1 rod shape-determining protein MreD [Leptolyngbyaceae cyanobacterium RM1_1_2]NJO08530.1 rod shape-determining protein MreD [Leptolyngbyaceae cyanobacterium SL_1_1]